MSDMRSLAYLLALCLLSCHDSPTDPRPTVLANGRWTGGNACLSVTDTGCNLAVGCGHGVFPKPAIRSDGTFDVDGTYRIEAGPISIDPAPPAHYSGTLAGSRLTLRVVPSSGSLPPASYSLAPSSAGTCPVPCL
jgi:hypothetical protein